MKKIYLFFTIYLLVSCTTNKKVVLNEQDIWKLKWRMVVSNTFGEYNKGVKQFDSLLLQDKNIKDKFLAIGLGLLSQTGDTNKIKKILSKQSAKTLQYLCQDELLYNKLSSYIDCKEFSEEINNPDLQLDLIKMYIKDQYIRGGNVDYLFNRYKIDKSKTLVNINSVVDVDNDNTENLIQIIEKHGFPTKKMVGNDGMEAIFFIIQHSPDKSFQAIQLKNIKKAAENDDLELQDYALLYDRILIGNKKKQKYGTQLDGNLNLSPVQNIEKLDSLRMAMDLMPIDLYIYTIHHIYNK